MNEWRQELAGVMSCVAEYVSEMQAEAAWSGHCGYVEYFKDLKDRLIKELNRIKTTIWGKKHDYDIDIVIRNLQDDYDELMTIVAKEIKEEHARNMLYRLIDKAFDEVLANAIIVAQHYVRDVVFMNLLPEIALVKPTMEPTDSEGTAYDAIVKYDGKEYSVYLTREDEQEFGCWDNAAAIAVMEQIDPQFRCLR